VRKFDDSFYKFANNIAAVLERNDDGSNRKDWEIQKEQLESLIAYEEKFKQSIYRSVQTREIYKKFIITTVQNNILSARPFFRERAKVFSKEITPAIKEGDYEELKKFKINYKFISFIRENWRGVMPKKANEYYEKVENTRRLLIENSLPLAVNIAKKFYRSTPNSHLELMDLINICVMGLLSGIDKYYMEEYTKVFRSVCIGRMKGGMVEDYSQTLMHFYPSDKKILYKANVIRHREKIDTEDLDQLAKRLNEALDDDREEGKNVADGDVSTPELMRLMNAASIVSADSNAETEEEGKEGGVYTYTKDEDVDIEEEVEKKDTLKRVFGACDDLSIVETKILKLKGISI
jgi:DNA-directed RNA polymerase specialized sigma subunit